MIEYLDLILFGPDGVYYAGAVSAILTIVTLVISTAAAINNKRLQRKAEKKAKEAADARKGFEIPTEGKPDSLPLVYGRAKVGGVRVYHYTSNHFKYAKTNADRRFETGANAIDTVTEDNTYTTVEWVEVFPEEYEVVDGDPGGITYYEPIIPPEWGAEDEGWKREEQFNGPGMQTEWRYYLKVERTHTDIFGGDLDEDIDDNRHDFMYFQQAICQGEINAVRDVIIERDMYIDDPRLGYNKYKSTKVDAAMRIDVHYGNTLGEPTKPPCALMVANDSSRETALFDGMAYLTAAIRLDRDDPQFNGVPDLQALVEGRKIWTYTNGTRSSQRVYTNNPAWCLLDYLMDTLNGKGLSESEIDVASFENAASICDKIVRTDAPVGGKFWIPTDGLDHTEVRDIPLYECNLIINPDKTVRENVEEILKTMGDAYLVWSAGKYELKLQYPESNDQIQDVVDITDADLVQGEDIEITFPSMDEKYNSCRVKFHNECNDFLEDSARWPVQTDVDTIVPIGGSYYGSSVNIPKYINSYGGRLNEFCVWGQTAETYKTYEIGYIKYIFVVYPQEIGTYRFSFGISGPLKFVRINNLSENTNTFNWEWSDTDIDYSLDDNHNWSDGDGERYNTDRDRGWDLSLGRSTAPTVYEFEMKCLHVGRHNYDKSRAMTAMLYQGDYKSPSKMLWNTREPAYNTYREILADRTVYNAMLEEDDGVELPTDIFAEGITDYYHALAKAESIVRSSRSAFVAKFTYFIRDKYLEPGDFVQLSSATLGLGTDESVPIYLRVEEVSLKENKQCEIKAVRFDYSQLAWNMDDNELVKPVRAYSEPLLPPINIEYWPLPNYVKDNSGKLTWDAPPSNVAYYDVYVSTGEYYTNGFPKFQILGRTEEEGFILPPLRMKEAFLGVRSISADGRKSIIKYLDINNATPLYNYADSLIRISADRYTFTKYNYTPILLTAIVPLSWSNNIDLKYEWLLDGFTVAIDTTEYSLIPFNDCSEKTVTLKVIDGIKSYTIQEKFYYLTSDISYKIRLFNGPVINNVNNYIKLGINKVVEGELSEVTSGNIKLHIKKLDTFDDSTVITAINGFDEKCDGWYAYLYPSDFPDSSRDLEIFLADATNQLVYDSVVITNLSSWGENLDLPLQPSPTGFIVTGAFNAIILEWDPSNTKGYLHTEILRSEVNNIDTAVSIGSSASTVFNDIPPDNNLSKTYYYWIRHVDRNGRPGSYNQLEGTPGSTADDPGYVLEVLTGEITEGQLYQDLNTRIDKIEVHGEAISAHDLAISAHDLAISANETAINNEQTVRQDADDALAQDITTVSAVANAKGDIYRQATQPAGKAGDLWFDTDDNNKPYYHDGNAWVEARDGEIALNAAAIQTEQTARADADSALSSEITTLASTVDGNTSAIQTEQTARIDGDNALAQDITTLQTTVDGNTSAIQTEQTARINGDGALASDISTLQVEVDGVSSSLQTKAEVSDLNSVYEVKIDAHNRITGFGLFSSETSSEFTVVADRFAIMPSDNTTGGAYPFVVENGKAYIQGAAIQDATIGGAKIANLAVDSAKIANAAITDAKIANAAITNAKIGTAAVKQANIDDAAVTNAKIDTAAVDTLQIKGNAVTVPASAQGAYSAQITITIPQDCYVLGISTFTQGAGKYGHEWSLYFNDSLIYMVKPIDGTTGAMSKSVWCEAGSVTVKIECATSSGDAECTVTALATMR